MRKDALTLFQREKDAYHPTLDLVGDKTGSESGQHERHTLRKIERQQREQRACGHLAASDDHCRQDHILRRRNASGKHRKPEIELQRREDDEHSIEIGGGALQRVHRVHLARAEQNEDARDAGLDKRVPEQQPPRQGLALLEPAADDLTDRQFVAGQQDQDRKDLHGPRGPENPRVVLAKYENERRKDDHQCAGQPGEDQHARALALEDLAGQPFLETWID